MEGIDCFPSFIALPSLPLMDAKVGLTSILLAGKDGGAFHPLGISKCPTYSIRIDPGTTLYDVFGVESMTPVTTPRVIPKNASYHPNGAIPCIQAPI